MLNAKTALLMPQAPPSLIPTQAPSDGDLPSAALAASVVAALAVLTILVLCAVRLGRASKPQERAWSKTGMKSSVPIEPMMPAGAMKMGSLSTK